MKYLIVILSSLVLFSLACENPDSTGPDDTAPVYISQPGNGAHVQNIVTVRAGVGADYTITRVVFYIDGDSVYNDNVSPFEYEWDTTIYPSGSSHTIYAVGYDADSSYTSITITVSIYVPTANEFENIDSYDLSAPVYRLAAQNDFLYAAMGGEGLRVMDVSSPSSIDVFYTFQPGTNMRGVGAAGQYLVTAERDIGIRLFDISSNDTVIVKAFFNTVGSAWNVKVVSNLAYVADNDRATIVSISNYNLSQIGQIPISTGTVTDLDVSGTTLFILDNNTVSAWDVSTTNPYRIALYDAFNGECQSISVYDNYVFVGTTTELRVLQLVSESLVSKASIAQQSGYTGVLAISSSVVFASQGGSNGGARVFDYSGDSTLTEIDSYIINKICYDIAYLDSYVYLATSTGIEILRFQVSLSN